MSNEVLRDTEPTERRISVKELTYPEKRTLLKISRKDWSRFIRKIKNLPRGRRVHRDLGLLFVAMGIESAIIAVIKCPWSGRDVTLEFLLHAMVSVCGIAIGIVSLLYDRALGEDESQDMEELLQDMQDVAKRASRSDQVLG